MRNLRATHHLRHPGESRDPLNSIHPASVSPVALIQGVPAFAAIGFTHRIRVAAAFTSPRFSGEREGPIAKQWEGEGLAGSWIRFFDQADKAALRRPLPLTLPAAARRAPTLSPLRFACRARVKARQLSSLSLTPFNRFGNSGTSMRSPKYRLRPKASRTSTFV
jgi:hypothetical protein